jgi:ferredoxin-NADP reductase
MTRSQTLPFAPVVEASQHLLSDPDTWSAYGAQWHSGEQKTLLCCDVREETHDVKTFSLRCADFNALGYEPGQFITVSPVIGGQMIARCYTLSSSPTRPFVFSITVKRVPGGTVSNWLHENLHVGGQLLASGPAGRFTPVGHPERKLLYLSAGSGITPLMSMARSSADLAAHLDIAFVHSARTPADIIFNDELTRMQATRPGLRVLNICESRGADSEWRLPVGRLDLQWLNEHVPDFKEREVFTCGPKGYMDAVKAVLKQGGFDFLHYHEESFDIAAALESPLSDQVPNVELAQTLFTITLARSGKTLIAAAGQSVLSAAKKAGAILPSSCGQGVCGTCKTAVLQGTVEMNHNGGIRQREIDKGFRLLCCSTPTSDLVLDL